MKRSALIMQCNLTVDSLARTSATRSAADMRTKQNMGVQQNNKTKLLLRFLLFSSLTIHPSFLPTYIPTYLPISPFFLTCLPIYLPTYIFLTYPLFYFSQSEPIATSLLSLYVVHMPMYFYLPTYISLFPTYLLTYLPTYPAFFFPLPTHRSVLARVNQELPACFLSM
jgi:hypothetical protein